MKTWKDLKEGDVIWYYDKYRMHPQQVTKVSIREVSKIYQGVDYKVIQKPKQYLDVYAGKNTVLSFYVQNAEEFETRRGGMTRFSCKESANKFLDRLCAHRQLQIDKLETKLAKYKQWMAKYPDSIK